MSYSKIRRGLKCAILIAFIFHPILTYSEDEQWKEILPDGSSVPLTPSTAIEPREADSSGQKAIERDQKNDKQQPIFIKIILPEKEEKKAAESLSWFDIATIALGSATVVLTGLAVILGFAAIFGYKEIKDYLIKAAETKAEAAAKDKAEVIAAREIAAWLKSHETVEENEDTDAIMKRAGEGNGDNDGQ